MNSTQAKKILSLYRDPIDRSDPQFAEALAQTKRDPDLADWLRQQNSARSSRRPIFVKKSCANVLSHFFLRAFRRAF
jgi:hypothetical protein